MIDKRHFEQAENEIRAGTVDPGIWAKAKALSGGDEKKVESLYLQQRAKHLATDRIATAVKSFRVRHPVIFWGSIIALVLIVLGNLPY